MCIDSSKFFKECKDGLEKLKIKFETMEKINKNRKLVTRDPVKVKNRIGRLIKNAEILLNSPERSNFDYMNVLCRLEAIDCLLWALRG